MKKTVFARMLVFAAVFMLLAALPAAAQAGADGGLAPEKGAAVRVMSYNLMHPDWSRIPVTGRDGIVTEILRAYRPDVVGLQEAGAKWHKALIPLLVETGLYAQACRQSHAEGFTYCTTTFLYDPQTVRLVEETILDLEFRHATRVVSVAVFERLTDGARFVVTNTHPAPSEEADHYARNMNDMMACVRGVTQRYPGLPLIMTGDYNTPEQSEMYTRLMSELDVRDAKYEADVLVRGCSTYFGYQVLPDTQDTRNCIDHIFVNNKAAVRLFEVVVGFEAQNASDHLPVYADIDLDSPGEGTLSE